MAGLRQVLRISQTGQVVLVEDLRGPGKLVRCRQLRHLLQVSSVRNQVLGIALEKALYASNTPGLIVSVSSNILVVSSFAYLFESVITSILLTYDQTYCTSQELS